MPKTKNSSPVVHDDDYRDDHQQQQQQGPPPGAFGYPFAFPHPAHGHLPNPAFLPPPPMHSVHPMPAQTSGASSRASPYGHGGLSARPTPLHRGAACLSCRKRKMKCDAVKPSCGPCTKQNKSQECEYEESKYMQAINKLEHDNNTLRTRVHQLESALLAASVSVPPAPPPTAPPPLADTAPYGNGYDVHLQPNGGPTYGAGAGNGNPHAPFSAPHGYYGGVGSRPGSAMSGAGSAGAGGGGGGAGVKEEERDDGDDD